MSSTSNNTQVNSESSQTAKDQGERNETSKGVEAAHINTPRSEDRVIGDKTVTPNSSNSPQGDPTRAEDRSQRAAQDTTAPVKGEATCPSGSVIATAKKLWLSKTAKKMNRLSPREIKGLKNYVARGFVFCMDPYEYQRGDLPLTKITHVGASNLCKSRGMRLCTVKEWQGVCTKNGAYAYSRRYRSGRCNVDEPGSSGEVESAKSHPKCSYQRIYDLIGNVSEWTQEGAVMGGHFETDAREARCSLAEKRALNRKSPLVGFRCCSDLIIATP